MTQHGAAVRPAAPLFRVAFVPGVTLDRWARVWHQRVPHDRLVTVPTSDSDQLAVLHEGRAEMCFLRLPVERGQLNIIPLYREVPVVVVPLDHPVTAYAEIAADDLTGEHLIDASVAPIKAVLEAVSGGAGVVIVPKSVALLHARKDLTHRPVTGVVGSQVGLAWRADNPDPRIETFIGIVRGRSERSSRRG